MEELAPASVAAVEESATQRSRIYYGYWLIFAAAVGQFATVGSMNYVPGVFLKPMTDEFGWNRAEFTLALTLGQFVLAFAGFFIGAYVDRHGGRRPVLVGTTVLVLALTGHTQIHALWQWIILNGLLVTAGGALAGNLVVNVTLSKWFVERRGRAIAVASMGVSFAGIVYPPATTAAVSAWGWRGAWLALAIASAVLLYPVAMLMRRAPEDYGLHPDGRSSAEVARGAAHAAQAEFATSLTRRQAIATPAFYLIVAAFGFGGLAIIVPVIQGIPFMTDAGYSRGVASFMIVLTSIPSMLTKPFWGYLVDKAPANRLAAIGFVLNAVAILGIVLSVNAHATPIVYASWLLLGFGWGGMIPLQEVVWATFFGRRYLGAVRSAGLPFSLLVSAGGPLLVSFYFDVAGDYNGALIAVAVLGILAALLVNLPRNPRRDVEVQRAAGP
ncbi:MAG: MFS transporter [Dehalococcoidia bacterium]